MRKTFITLFLLALSVTVFAQQPTPPSIDNCRLHKLSNDQEASTKYVLISPVKQLEISIFHDGSFVLKEVFMQSGEIFMSMGSYNETETLITADSDKSVYNDFIASLENSEKDKYQFKELSETWTKEGDFLRVCSN